MRIAILLQSLDETWGGIGVYTREIVTALLQVDTKNEYILIYPRFGIGRTRRGQFRRYKNAIEIETEESRVPFGTYWIRWSCPASPRVTTWTSCSTPSSPCRFADGSAK